MSLARASHVLLLLTLAIGLRAQTFFEHLTRADGLPGDQVLALHEDRDGFIWIGTESGLARHEGVRIHTWYHDRKDPYSLPNNTVWDITADEHGDVWIATDHGLCRYDARAGRFDRVFVTQAYHDPTSANRIHHVRSDGHGLLWLSTEDGLHTVSINEVPREVPLPDGGARITRFTEAPKAMRLSVDPDHHGLWIGTSTGLIFRDSRNGTYRSASAPDFHFPCLDDPQAQCAIPDGSGGLWYFTLDSRELIHLDQRGVAVAHYHVSAPDNRLPSPQFLMLDQENGLWMSTWGQELKLLDIAQGTWSAIEHEDDVPWTITNTNAKSWLKDREGRIWIGTYTGLNVIDPGNTELSSVLIGTPQHRTDVSAIAPMDGSHLLVGTAGSGAVLVDRRTGLQRTLQYNGPLRDTVLRKSANYILCCAKVSDGWLLGSNYGLLRVDTARGQLERLATDPDGSTKVSRTTIQCIQNDPRGVVWVGTWRSGLFRLGTDGSAVRFDSISPDTLPSRKLLAMAVDRSDVWLGFNDGAGMCRLKDDRIVERALNEADSTGANYGVVSALAVDSDGTLYIGTLIGGLGVRDPKSGSIQWHTRSDGLPGDRIEQIVLDHGTGLWLRTDDGLCRFDRTTHAIDRIDPPASMRVLGSLGAIGLDGDGSLLCAYGPSVVDLPTRSVAHGTGPEVVLTSLRFAGQALAAWSVDSTIVLRHDARALAIEYGVRSFFNGQTVRFAYRVSDIDSSWRNLGSTSRLDLNDLPPGRHHVQIRANNGGSSWTRDPLSLKVEVLPAFWATWWFRGALLLGISATLYLFVRGYVNERLREQRERLEREQAVLAERMRIAGDMHDDLGAGLSALKLRSEMALRVEKDPQKREQLGSLANTAGDLIGSMRQIIWTMNADQTGVEDLVVYTTNYARSYCEQNNLSITVEANGPWPGTRLSSEQRRNMFLVVKEALHNTVKHAHAGSVQLHIRWADGIHLELRDDGVGLPNGTEDAVGNGLRNMRKRIGSLGGTISMNGENGTCLRFHVPIAQAT